LHLWRKEKKEEKQNTKGRREADKQSRQRKERARPSYMFFVEFVGLFPFTVGVFAAKVIKAAAKYIFGFAVPISQEFLLAL